ncbi:hypothetical protein HS048_34845 [Planomonospora sp. ID91781]|uniref:hypothetical protein n=1 Tax=Planomonospora sp. ID91781 TaxID=2738135 RepID=UPI0018C3798E|nr:hypothetical protein [Planomonospora sp. ID91781]MBG0825863.1 hypothetical protein [Planomonospora sp. ID91781]
MIDIIGRWRAFEKTLRDRELDWGLHFAPEQLRYARSAEHPRGAGVDHLLPADYRAFVSEVGYPVIGFGYYDRDGISFLPPEAMARLSVDLPAPEDVWPEPADDRPTLCRYAFFAGYDLSEIEGYSFGPAAGGGEPVVWLVERGMPQEEIGTFTEWLDGEISRLHAYVTAFETDEITALREKNGGEGDPHRLLDYSLGGSYDQAPYTAQDLDLAWVESQESSPYSYGLIDGTGAWRIPLGKRFRSVLPFRDGAAEVILNEQTTSYAGPRITIRPDGSPTGH